MEQYLETCLNSIINQTLSNLEIIVIDDGSIDNSMFVLNKFQSEYDNIKVISQENQGPGKARNVGIDNSKGQYIAFLDADDIFIDNTALDKMYDIATKNNANVVSANMRLLDENYKMKKTLFINFDNPYWIRSKAIKPEKYGIPYGFTKNIYNHEFLIENNIKFPIARKGEDPIFLSKVLINTDIIFTVPLNLYGYNHTNGGGVNNKIMRYEDKLAYLKHFNECFNILEEGNLLNTSKNYKRNLFAYLTWQDNLFDEELYQIYDDLFSDLDNFDKNYREYIRFKTAYAIHYLLNSDSEDYFREIKKEFNEINLGKMSLKDKIFMKFINKSFNEYKKKIQIIKDAESLDDFKLKYSEYQ